MRPCGERVGWLTRPCGDREGGPYLRELRCQLQPVLIVAQHAVKHGVAAARHDRYSRTAYTMAT
jgi:hypothetical protein